jgi:hypothetical protein
MTVATPAIEVVSALMRLGVLNHNTTTKTRVVATTVSPPVRTSNAHLFVLILGGQQGLTVSANIGESQ